MPSLSLSNNSSKAYNRVTTICINNDFSADLMDEENGFMYNVPYSHIEYCDEWMDDVVIDSETPVDWSTKYEI